MSETDYSKIAEAGLEEVKSKSWKEMLDRDDDGRIRKNIKNILCYVENHPKYKGKLKYNDFLQRKEYDGQEFNDFIESQIYYDLTTMTGINKKSELGDVLNKVFDEHRYSPVVEYLKSLEWDGQKRIERLFIDLLEADDTELNKSMTKKWMIASVKRIMKPGCKFDNMIVLQGGQGIGKSTICERLGRGFYNTISLSEIDNKDIVAKMNMTWIGIIDELDHFDRKGMESIKTFLSSEKETVRLAYERNARTFNRHCVFIGSTNDDTFLRDNGVERRFWVIKCNRTEKDSSIRDIMTDDYVNQLWAEAYHYYREDPNQYLDLTRDEMDEFGRIQEQFKSYNDDDIIEYIKDILDGQYHINEDGEVTDIDQIDNNFLETEKHYINKIKGYVLNEMVAKKFREKRSNRYIESALGYEWEYKDVRFKNLDNKVVKAWVRKQEKNNKDEKKPYNPMDEFLVGLDI